MPAYGGPHLASLAAGAERLNILHVLRAPVGGLFRHVIDLAREQAACGHRIGLVADASSGGAQAETKLARLAPSLALGVARVPMSRQLGWRDAGARLHVARRAIELGADIVHGHGAKGGAYARLISSSRAIRVYTPHGGSLHYGWSSPSGFLYLASERLLMRRTDLFLFESAYGLDTFQAKLGKPSALARVVHNGVGVEEFASVTTERHASDLLFVGELRALKGIDVLIEAIATLSREGKRISATVVGEGPDRSRFESLADARGLGSCIRFTGTKPARAAFTLGRVLVVPSRAESLPYIVLEAAAAGLPIIATCVGGLPEIFGPDAASLVQPGNPLSLAAAINRALVHPSAALALAGRLQARVRSHFSLAAMAQAVLAAYAEVRCRRRQG
jgi:glycosyltransferase involved in cell wall biosynthesis